MASALGTAVEHLRSAVAPPDAGSDGQLLGRFVRTRDEAAFAALVRRLGPGVLAVCRRACPDSHLADDAFQAAFLVLARKAESVRPRDQVAAWLFGVAFRTASKARAMLLHRRRRESVASHALPDPPSIEPHTPDDDDLRRLDAAVARLPDHLRAAVVLCELEGRSRKDVAKHLGIPEGTLSSRLAKARKLLGEHLGPRRLVAVPAALAVGTAKAAVGSPVSETVLTLAEGVSKMLLFDKVRMAVVGLVAIVVVTVGGVTAVAAGERPDARRKNAPVPKEKSREGQILIWNDGKPMLLSPDGKVVRELQGMGSEARRVGIARLSPDGARVAVLSEADSKDLAGDQKIADYTLTVWDISDPTNRREIKLKDRQIVGGLAWSRDGKRLYTSTVTLDGVNAAIKQGKPHPLHGGEVAVIHAGTGRSDPLTIPEDHFVLGEAADGRLVVGNFRGEVSVCSADGKKVERVNAEYPKASSLLALSHGGGRVLMKVWDNTGNADRLVVLDLATAKFTPLTPDGLPASGVMIHNATWSPDGKKVLFLYQRIEPKPPQVPGPAGEWINPRGYLCVADADGSNGKVIREDDDGHKLTFFDWR